jgi:phosphotransferase system enzyme I (PtsI)
MLLIDPKEIVTFRTLDIGGDKILPYYKFEHEDNPFLGERSVRFSLARPEIFKTQLRALIRAAYYGKAAIMFPMVATLDEFSRAKNIYNQCYDELKKEGAKIPAKKDIEVGLMIEIPAAVMLSDQFAKVADFFSIGTNDLIQYSMAADRLSEKVRYLYQPKNPSILRLIDMAIKNGKKAGIRVAVCGETAADPEMIPILIGMGLEYFSVSPSAILRTKKQISRLSQKEQALFAKKVMKY